MSEPGHFLGIPVLHTKGTHYQVGYSIGSTFGDRIRRYWAESAVVRSVLVPYGQREDGLKFYNTALVVCKENFPQYIKELQGMSDGAGMEFRQLFLLNVSAEVCVALFQHGGAPGSGCSDVLVNRPGCKIIGHNEDGESLAQQYMYGVSAHIVEGGQTVEHFTALCYPGVLAGTAVSFNGQGLAFTLDAFYCRQVVLEAPPRNFLIRACLRASSVEDLVSILKNAGFGVDFGFTLNVADFVRRGSMWSLEVTHGRPEAIVHLWEIPESQDLCHYTHYNMAKHVAVDLVRDESSVRRLAAENRHPTPKTRTDVASILGDTADPEYPIYRTGRPPDSLQTIFTAILDVSEGTLDVYLDNPCLKGAEPTLSLALATFQGTKG